MINNSIISTNTTILEYGASETKVIGLFSREYLIK